MSGESVPQVGAPMILCDHRCVLPDGHDGPHQHGYYLPAVSRTSDRDELDRLYARRAATARGIVEAQGHHTPEQMDALDCINADIDAWIARDRARQRAEALEEAAVAARSMYDPPKAECVEWADWLDARAARIRNDAGIGGGGSDS